MQVVIDEVVVDGRSLSAVPFESLQELGVSEADAAALARPVLLRDANRRIDVAHAAFLRSLTGNATSEERDTWKTKEEAARAFIAGNATDGQTALIELEAQGEGTEPAALAQVIVGKAESFQKLIGMAAGLKNKAKAAVKQAAAADAPVDQIVREMDRVFSQIQTEIQAAVQAWEAGS